jgi:hypothetical protein
MCGAIGSGSSLGQLVYAVGKPTSLLTLSNPLEDIISVLQKDYFCPVLWSKFWPTSEFPVVLCLPLL